MRTRTGRSRHTPGPSISDTLEDEHREKARASAPSTVTTPPPEKRFGLRRDDGELIATGTPACLRKLKATLGGDAHVVVRLAKSNRRIQRSTFVGRGRIGAASAA